MVPAVPPPAIVAVVVNAIPSIVTVLAALAAASVWAAAKNVCAVDAIVPFVVFAPSASLPSSSAAVITGVICTFTFSISAETGVAKLCELSESIPVLASSKRPTALDIGLIVPEAAPPEMPKAVLLMALISIPIWFLSPVAVPTWKMNCEPMSLIMVWPAHVVTDAIRSISVTKAFISA